ncbi:hypothetical protein OGATHE_003878 [Ogataea polymorpha]|uniref:Uncharacterized protein n=1 Tax=Ogataea polymorpha TaxID=460523 RepID=A0A9P8P3A5_9ASCO|nr:hypothetical protein OGATHE_003878 [Ogataea polymorpha]
MWGPRDPCWWPPGSVFPGWSSRKKLRLEYRRNCQTYHSGAFLSSVGCRGHADRRVEYYKHIKDHRLITHYLQLTRVGDLDPGTGGAGSRAELLNGLDNIVALDNLAKDNVLAVQPRTWNSRDEELGAVGVWTSIGHRKQTRLRVLVVEVLVRELGAVDALATGTVEVGEVSTLQHEVWNDSVEDGALVAKALLSSAQGSEVFGSLWNVIVQGEHDFS